MRRRRCWFGRWGEACQVADYPPSEFEVDLADRSVTHEPSGIRFSFYEYTVESDWLASDSVIFRDNPQWHGDRAELARSAKAAAVIGGMTAKRPAMK